MTLDYTSSAAVAAAVRLRLDASPAEVPFLIVEGSADRSFIARVLHPQVVVVPASNREKVLGARALLREAHLERCTFLVDCDGSSVPEWRSIPGLVSTDYRDIDADAALSLNGVERVLQDCLAGKFDNGRSLAEAVRQVTQFAVQVTTICGVVTDRARAEGLPLRIVCLDRYGRQRRRRVRADDLSEFTRWADTLQCPTSMDSVVHGVSSRLGWSEDAQKVVSDLVASHGDKQCRSHGAPNCRKCLPRRFANGHDLIAVVRAVLENTFSIVVEEGALERAVRLGVDETKLWQWRVARRLHDRAIATGRTYLREPNPGHA